MSWVSWEVDTSQMMDHKIKIAENLNFFLFIFTRGAYYPPSTCDCLIDQSHKRIYIKPRKSGFFKYKVDRIKWSCWEANASENRMGGPRAVMVKALDCGIIVSMFELQSHYYVHFQTNTLGKGMNPLYLPSNGLNSTTTVLERWLWH